MISGKDLKLIAEGNTAEIYEIAPDRILKLFRAGMPREACRKEFECTRIAGSILQEVPETFEEIDRDGRPGIIYEKIIGRNMLGEMLSKIWNINRQSKRLARYHAGIQKKFIGQLPTVKEKLRGDIIAGDLLDTDDKNKIIDYLDTLPDGNILCHFDFHPGNILIRKNDHVIIDWMTACTGDRSADVARTGIMLKYGVVPRTSRPVQALAGAVQKHIYKAYVKEYKRITGITQEAIDQWELPIAAGRLLEWLPEKEKTVLSGFIRAKLKEFF